MGKYFMANICLSTSFLPEIRKFISGKKFYMKTLSSKLSTFIIALDVLPNLGLTKKLSAFLASFHSCIESKLANEK